MRHTDEAPAVAEALGLLREKGERVTAARRAVLQVLDDAREHLCAEDIAERVDVAEPGVHRATVYRSLQSLTELGIVAHTHVPGSATIYHLRHSEASRHNHAHLQCTTCERFFDVPTDWLAPLGDRLRQDLGFELDSQHAALLGTCAECHKAASEARNEG
ncbi:transcriptional repressor [Flexivirga endophytica]|uniref:Transcriptional repressor n=1 Tax=Flexivirga endophytica TaxID=1849103 RepID=A0A916T651_9MICO|nr:Fur family transcriptional regulator [Flexivirga endophytica]GGB30238.1 transcriptional repressor [Flexivirga endophytica]GHB51154.1 transcriptional repressor [Flexivirga endophytica]